MAGVTNRAGNLTAGPTWRSDEGLTPNHLGAQFWYHYQPHVVGSMGIEMSDWVPSRTKSLFTTQYLVALSWVPLVDSQRVLDLALRLGGLSSTTTLDTDTVAGAKALSDKAWDWQVGLRVGGGWNRGRWGMWASTGPIANWRASGPAAGWNMSQESELGFSLSLRKQWNAESFTRSWNLIFRLPVVYQPRAPVFTREGMVYRTRWTVGVQVGPSVLF